MTEPATPGILITRHFDAPPEAVFDAWTDPVQFASWFGTAATKVVDVVLDVRVGGGWRARMLLPDANEIAWHGTYVEVDRPHRLAMTLSDRPGDEFEPLTVDLIASGGGTDMTFTQAGGHLTNEQYQQAQEGWRGFFDDLAAGLAR